MFFFFFFFNDTATTEIYTLSLHDALPISLRSGRGRAAVQGFINIYSRPSLTWEHLDFLRERSEEHTSELQSQSNLVCRLLLEKKKNVYNANVLRAIGVLCVTTSRQLKRVV